MARIKYSEEAEPIRNEHFGFTFQPNNYGQSMFPASKSKRFRRPRQNYRQQNLQKAVTQWRNMSPATQAAWDSFAAAFEQPSKNNPLIFLSGYQTFIKRNSYCFLNHGIESEFMTEPDLEPLIYESTGFVLEQGDNSIDLTELYISNFGLLPSPGQWLLFCCIPYSDISGQFFEPIFDKLQVQSVYVDGFFLKLELPENSSNILYSIYLSKPVSPGISYVGTKIRYMGCFTSKKLTDLTDIPAVSPADDGKVLTVQPDGSFGWNEGGGGGGLTCEALPACPTIIDIYANITELYQVILDNIGTSIPKIRFGYLYNWYAIMNINLSSSDEWFVPLYVDFISWVNSFSSMSAVGAYLKQTGYENIQSPNTGALNTSLFSFIAGGNRGQTGVFGAILSSGDYRFRNPSIYLTTPVSRIGYNTINVSNSSQSKTSGSSSRMMKLNSTAPNGTFGQYIGNNGIIYKTVVFNGWEMTINNLAETKWRDGSTIPKVTLAAEWAALTSEGMCAYNNDELYV